MSDENLQPNVLDHREHRFAMVTKSVLDDEKILTKPYEKLVYAILCMYADNKTKKSFPTVKTIARKAFCGESTARAALKRLREVGLIKVVPKYHPVHGQVANTYILLEPPAEFSESTEGDAQDREGYPLD